MIDFPNLYIPHVSVTGIPEKIIIVGGGFTTYTDEQIEEDYKILSINNHIHDDRHAALKSKYDIFLEYTWYDLKGNCEKSRGSSSYPIVYFHPNWCAPGFKTSSIDFEILTKEGHADGMGSDLNECAKELNKIGRRPSTGAFMLPWLASSHVKKVILVGFDGWMNLCNHYINASTGFDSTNSCHNLDIEFKYISKYIDKIHIQKTK
jgi:hypothetical protein